ncbi:MAG: kynureninase [Paracoccus sp. (in: a-proteobacteria)]|uniref:kynureninase n=1 Tax=unclassified Paracoccus (in: a-proteobacteria) TaxID=2688777 RepID=UPI0025D9387D|nr:kynureninase [Paracoccus sp. UBA889]|tara:strand:+ start:4617 stop:5804 length:1188 start_codon:yes stop_codon:yes gene_type:complete
MTDFSRTKRAFHLPSGVTYLDGNSLGPMPRAAQQRVAAMMADEWSDMLITGWNKAGWYEQPQRVGNRIARLIGAGPGEVVMGDTLSIKVFQALSAALALRPEQRVILSDSGNFPSDLYVAQGLATAMGARLRVVAPESVADAIGDDLAVLMLTEVDYRTGRRHDMAALTARAHRAGALTIWDLAHSAGAVDVDLTGSEADFAVGCTYKYLNGGPGAPAFIWVNPRHADVARPILQGWMGHEAPFAFTPDYAPAPGIERMRVGTPPVIAMAALEAALDVWDEVSMDHLRAKSVDLTGAFIAEVEASCPDLLLNSPRDPERRGSQVGFRHRQGHAVMQALIAEGVIGDFRAPDVMRFGFAPLYNDRDDVSRAAATLARILRDEGWKKAQFMRKAAVT